MQDLKVLIVDDHMLMKALLRQHLGAAGIHDITEASNGVEALKKIDQLSSTQKMFDIVLADWNMPTMDGITLLRELKEKRRLQNLGFIMITAESEKSRILEALQAGATSYMVKPISQEDVLAHLNKTIDWLKGRKK